MTWMELIDGVPIRLAAIAGADPARFIAAFRAVWAQLPRHVRTTLLEYWRVGNATVYLTPGWEYSHRHVGQTCSLGTCFHFLSSVVERLPDDLLQTCIVH